MASYSLTTLWYERQRYVPGVLAVAFSALLIALQCGLLLGLFSITSIPIDHTQADVWMGASEVSSVDLGRPIPESAQARMGVLPEIESCEPYLQGFAFWSKPNNGGSELCMVIGSRLLPNSLGKIDKLTDEQCGMLAEEGTVIIDKSDEKKLGVEVYKKAEISGQPVHVVSMTRGLPSLAGPYVLCSINTARKLLPVQKGETTTYILGRCKNRQDAPRVVEKLKATYKDVSAFTQADFSLRTQLHWLLRTKAGIALGYAAALGLLVGAVVTSQTLYAATIASLREYAVLRALGIPRWRIAGMVVSESFWIGIIGIALALPAAYGLAWAADRLMGVTVVSLPWWLQSSAAAVTLIMSLGSGLFALRSLRQIDPAMLLH
ncbi:MAG TPA: ABC transporter permease [Gemmataceae bacterium]|jgi:putative ABC transport system permease protein